MPTPDEIKIIQKKYGLSYQINYAFHCEDIIGFADKDVMEIGGALPSEFVFNTLNAKTWTSITQSDSAVNSTSASRVELNQDKILIQKDFTEPKKNHYTYFQNSINALPESHFKQYDLIFSIATIEHILKLPLALEKMYNALRPNGKLFAIFSPVWSAYNGHHITATVDKAGNEITMNNGFIPPWGHLVMGPSSMYAYLLTKTDNETAAEITYQIYNAPTINRFFSEDYLNFIKETNFTIEKFDTLFNQTVPPYTQKKLEELNPGKKSFGNNGLLIVLNKE